MTKSRGDLVICIICVGSVTVVILVVSVLEPLFSGFESDSSWILRLLLNCMGYATVFLPGYLILNYIHKSNYIDRPGNSIIWKLVRECYVGSESAAAAEPVATAVTSHRSLLQDGLLLSFCFIGLQISYLSWGLLQEKIMTKASTNTYFKEYISVDGTKGIFKDSQFLVFVNRILAFALAGCYILLTRQNRHTTPLYKYSYCSFSNILSSWCQYEALKFVSFPSQVLAKACKVIPVMIMGKMVSRNKYEYYEYLTALLISVGMTLFLLGAPHNSKIPDKHSTSSLSGVVLLCGYLLLDSFTSNWQGALFKQHHVTSMQMMCGVNLFSCLFTSISLLHQGGFQSSFAFMTTYGEFTIDCVILSICSAAGQLFIFFTISKYGAVVFAIIMTVRQGLAILLSCVVYHHEMTVTGIIGVLIVFTAVFLRIYCSHRLKSIHRRRNISAASTPLPTKV